MNTAPNLPPCRKKPRDFCHLLSCLIRNHFCPKLYGSCPNNQPTCMHTYCWNNDTKKGAKQWKRRSTIFTTLCAVLKKMPIFCWTSTYSIPYLSLFGSFCKKPNWRILTFIHFHMKIEELYIKDFSWPKSRDISQSIFLRI